MPETQGNSSTSTEGGNTDSTEERNPATQQQGQEGTGTEPEDDLSKAKRHASHWQTEAKKVAKEREQLRAELERLQEASQTEQEKALNEAAKKAREEAVSEWRPRYEGLIKRNTALQLLGGRVKAPSLLLPHLNLDSIEIDESGQVDETAIRVAIDRVLEEYPFLANEDGSGGAPIHHGDLGPRRNSTSGKHDPNELLRAALRR